MRDFMVKSGMSAVCTAKPPLSVMLGTGVHLVNERYLSKFVYFMCRCCANHYQIDRMRNELD